MQWPINSSQTDTFITWMNYRVRESSEHHIEREWESTNTHAIYTQFERELTTTNLHLSTQHVRISLHAHSLCAVSKSCACALKQINKIFSFMVLLSTQRIQNSSTSLVAHCNYTKWRRNNMKRVCCYVRRHVQFYFTRTENYIRICNAYATSTCNRMQFN